MKNLAEWRENAIQFLSSHKKYRVFGPTLLGELHCRNEDKPGHRYTPSLKNVARTVDGSKNPDYGLA